MFSASMLFSGISRASASVISSRSFAEESRFWRAHSTGSSSFSVEGFSGRALDDCSGLGALPGVERRRSKSEESVRLPSEYVKLSEYDVYEELKNKLD